MSSLPPNNISIDDITNYLSNIHGNDIQDGTITNAKIQNLNASKITGTLDTNIIPGFNTKLSSATILTSISAYLQNVDWSHDDHPADQWGNYKCQFFDVYKPFVFIAKETTNGHYFIYMHDGTTGTTVFSNISGSGISYNSGSRPEIYFWHHYHFNPNFITSYIHNVE